MGVLIADCFTYRPVQEKIHVESHVPLSGRGVGWDTMEAEQWFSRNPHECRQRAASTREISEDRVITRTMTHMVHGWAIGREDIQVPV